MSQLPIAAQWIQLAATIVIAIGAAFIAYRQWRTAHQKVVLDLFERRMKVYDDACEVLVDVLRNGDTPFAEISKFSRVIERIKFLYGDEGVACAVKTRDAMSLLHEAMRILNSNAAPLEVRETNATKAATAMRTVSEFFTEFPRLMLPYVRMTQRLDEPFLSRLLRRFPLKSTK